MAEYTAKEIQRQSERVITQIGRLRKSVNSTTGAIEKIAKIVDSEDSSLAAALSKDASTLDQLEETIYQKFYVLADKMNIYAMNTIANEEQLSQETEAVDKSVQGVADIVSSLNPESI